VLLFLCADVASGEAVLDESSKGDVRAGSLCGECSGVCASSSKAARGVSHSLSEAGGCERWTRREGLGERRRGSTPSNGAVGLAFWCGEAEGKRRPLLGESSADLGESPESGER